MSTVGWIGGGLAMTATVLAVAAIVDLWRQPKRRLSRLAWTGLILLGLAGSTRGPVIRSETDIQTEMRTEVTAWDGTLRTSWILPFLRVDRRQVSVDQSGAIWTERRVSVHFGWTLPLVLVLYGAERARRRSAEVHA